MRYSKLNQNFKRWSAGSAIVLSFIVALEIVIMISPFAFFFYAVFNPFLLALNHSDLTRWLTAFFLPHMIVPPNELLILIRILGSALFVAGMLIFFICTVQVYVGKLLKKGTATKGFYVFIRHPQYAGLSLAAIGLAIMWPRFLTLVLLAVMLFLYYILARDEEARMLTRFGKSYSDYMNRTGMFIPRAIEKIYKNSNSQKQINKGRLGINFLLILIIIVGSGFAFRMYTIHHLPIERIQNVDVITISRSDLKLPYQLLPVVTNDSAVSSKLELVPNNVHHHILAYFIPVYYLMQGMIANTGKKWKLFEQHKTLGMITDYILHPFAHLTGSHTRHFINMQNGVYIHPMQIRRIIFIDVFVNQGELTSPYDDFDINAERKPLFFADVNIHTGKILQMKDTPSGSGWGSIPTPMF